MKLWHIVAAFVVYKLVIEPKAPKVTDAHGTVTVGIEEPTLVPYSTTSKGDFIT